MSPTSAAISTIANVNPPVLLGREHADARLDLVRDVRDHLHGLPQELAAALTSG
jgi:hypothetical protein